MEVSRKCLNMKENTGKFKKGHKQSIESRLKMSLAKLGKTPPNKGIPMTEETKLKVSLSKMGSVPWNKGKRGIQIAWNKGVGNKTSEAKKIRSSLEYRDWRIAVFARDNYTCQECGNRGMTLNADHIKPFAYYPELRLVIENGRTLCHPCHKKTSTYGGKGRRLKNAATTKWRCVASS